MRNLRNGNAIVQSSFKLQGAIIEKGTFVNSHVTITSDRNVQQEQNKSLSLLLAGASTDDADKLKVRLIKDGRGAVYVGPEQDVAGCPLIPGLKPRVLKEQEGAKFLQEDLPKQNFKDAVVILANEESDIKWVLQHLPTREKNVTVYNPKTEEESLASERNLERFLEEDTGCLVTLGSLFNGMECATVVFVYDNPYASHFRANFLRASVELILIDRNKQGSTLIPSNSYSLSNVMDDYLAQRRNAVGSEVH